MDQQAFELIMARFDQIERSLVELRDESRGNSRARWILHGAIGMLGVLVGYVVEVWAKR